MLRKIRLKDFKNFEDAILDVGPFTVIVGANASGKSNIRDAFRFLHGIGRGYTLAEIIGGKYGAGGQSEWAQMRGAASEITRFTKSEFKIEVEIRLSKFRYYNYSILVEKTEHSRFGFKMKSETLRYGRNKIFTSHPGDSDPVHAQEDEAHFAIRMGKIGNQKKYGDRFDVRTDQPALSQIIELRKVASSHKERALEVLEIFGGIRFLDLIPELMRKPAFPGQTTLGDSGENLPTVLQDICADAERKAILVDWVRELTPIDVVDFDFPRDPITGLVQMALKEGNGNEVSAYSASDGTLRFLAMLAALLGSNPAKLYFFEEIDNGIHPARLRLLLELIESQTAKGKVQVVTTTHSPDLLTMVGDETFKSTSVVNRLPSEAAAAIYRVADLPHAEELRSSQGLGRLLASGWLEDALAFTSRDNLEAF